MADKLHFESDYMEGCAPEILRRLTEINYEKNIGYGLDVHCESAAEKIRKACGCPKALVKFISGGTQTNVTVIAAVLRSWQGAVSVTSGHINAHEAGALEATGHKIISLPAHDGKMDAGELEEYLTTFFADGNVEHLCEPGLVYISFPTEYGTLYTKDELEALHKVCKKFKIPLFLDGARLGYGLAASKDVKMEDLGKLCDIFYIGGTKCGAMFGEAVVVTNPELTPHFFTVIKQHGALLAKGWMLGVQFDVLFTDNLYLKICQNAIDNAMYLKEQLQKRGIKFFNDSVTNQQFFIFENEKLKKLEKVCGYGFWEKYDENHTVIRFATSWATRNEDINKLLELIDELDK